MLPLLTVCSVFVRSVSPKERTTLASPFDQIYICYTKLYNCVRYPILAKHIHIANLILGKYIKIPPPSRKFVEIVGYLLDVCTFGVIECLLLLFKLNLQNCRAYIDPS